MTEERKKEIRGAALIAKGRHERDQKEFTDPKYNGVFTSIDTMFELILELTEPVVEPQEEDQEGNKRETLLKNQVEFWANFAIWFNKDYFGFTSDDSARKSVENDLRRYEKYLDGRSAVAAPEKGGRGIEFKESESKPKTFEVDAGDNGQRFPSEDADL